MRLTRLIDARDRDGRAFQAALHDKELRTAGGDDGRGLVHGRRMAHLERMKARRGRC